MRNAVSQLMAFIDSKTNHSSNAIKNMMAQLCDTEHLFTDKEAQQEFAQICSNFDIHCQEWLTTSWGRNVFTNWWLTNAKYCNVIPVGATLPEKSKLETNYIIVGNGVIQSELFTEYPSEEQIVQFLIKYTCNYAEVEKRYRLID